MFSIDDSDIKIFSKKNDKAESIDFINLAEQLDIQHRNGNLSRVNELGRSLAELSPENEPLKSEIQYEFLPPNYAYQIRVLAIFTAQAALHKNLPLPMLSSAAVNSLYSVLEETTAGFYENLAEGVAFSFYYLPLRRGQNVEEKIGECFAMLCGKEGNEKLQKLGSEVYRIVDSFVEKKISQLDLTE